MARVKKEKSLTPKVKKIPKAREPSEADITKAIRDVLKACNIWHFKHWSGPLSLKGISDIIGMINGRFFAIEIKTRKGAFQAGQEEFLRSVNRAGGIGIVARSVDDVIEALDLGDRFLDLK